MLDSPLPQLDRLFDYAIPDALVDVALPGVRVKVPLRSSGRSARGYLVELASASDYAGSLAPLDEVVSEVPVLAPEVWALARRVADRAAGSASDVVRLAIPPRQVRVEKAYLAARAAAAPEQPGAPGRTRTLAEPEDPTRPAFAIEGYPRSLVDAVGEGARLAVGAVPVPRRIGDQTVLGWALTAAQFAASVVARGRTAILAVPDYRDQSHLERALHAVVGADHVIAWDARQPGPDRYRNFLRALDGAPAVILGTRSAVYAPAEDLGLLLVWDDGDPLHSEPLSPYVHTRDAALIRQEQSGCALVFLSHTRSSDVERLVEIGFVRSVEPDPRVLPRVIPTLAQDEASGGHRARIPSTAFQAAQTALLEGPVLVQVARPGYAPVLRCASCGDRARCTTCSGPLRIAEQGAPPSCGWCGAIASPWICPTCEGTRLRVSAAGSVRTAEELGRAFPGVRVVVSDGSRPLLTVPSTPALVVATRGAEPVADGGYRCVLLADADRLLARESLWVAEDSLRTWSNTIALAAPGARSYLIGVGGDLATTLVTWRQPAWARREVDSRRSLRFPPTVRIASVTGAGHTVASAIEGLKGLTRGTDAELDILGPVESGDGLTRAIVRFDYALGGPVADHLRAAVIKNATGRRRLRKDGEPQPAPALRVHLDDREALE